LLVRTRNSYDLVDIPDFFANFMIHEKILAAHEFLDRVPDAGYIAGCTLGWIEIEPGVNRARCLAGFPVLHFVGATKNSAHIFYALCGHGQDSKTQQANIDKYSFSCIGSDCRRACRKNHRILFCIPGGL